MISSDLENYALQHTSEEDPVLHSLYRETHLKVMYPRMLSGHLQGRLLETISRMLRPSCILEIGTYTGYSAICLARGLKEGGKLITIEVSAELVDFAAPFFMKAGLSGSIIQLQGDALELVPGLDEAFDLVFIDADKENYVNYYNLVFDKVRTGGYILADNVLWDGKVLEPWDRQDKETRGITAFNAFIREDDRVDKVMLPVRDGLMIIRKRQT